MKWRVLAVLVAVVVLQSTGCCRHCRCCGSRDRILSRDARKDEIPPPDVLRNEGPPPPVRPTGTGATPQGSPQPTGAYGGS